MFPLPIAIVDIETSGMAATSARITEIGIVTVTTTGHVEEWSTLINPECSIQEEIQILTGITNDMVRHAPTFKHIAHELQNRLAGHLFIAHNARFDYGFIKNEFRRLEIPFTAEVLCTVRLSRRLYPDCRSHSLDALRDRHLLTWEERHRALGDARATWQFIQVVLREHTVKVFADAIKALLKMPSLPPQLAPGVLDNLPEGPGVYIFYGINDLPIYIGKGKNLRIRIRSHFSSDHRSANDQRLSAEITRITYEETAGELGALVREAELVKKLMPLHNHRLRRNCEVSFIRLENLNEFPEILKVDQIDFSHIESLYGPFSTKNRIRDLLLGVAAEHGLCWRVVDRNNKKAKMEGPCFAHQLRRCKGYCVGKESLMQHNLRLLQAIARFRFGKWPYEGAIAIKERHPDNQREMVYLFDRWLYRGRATNDAEWHELQSSSGEFDADIYQILQKYLQKGGIFEIKKNSCQLMH